MNSIFYGEMMEFLSLREKVLANKTITMDRCALLSFDQHLAQRRKSELLINEDDVISWVRPQLGSTYVW